MRIIISLLLLVAAAGTACGQPHPGRSYIEKNGYQGPQTCEQCHRGVAKKFLQTVHWKHSSPVEHVENLEPGKEYGMLNRIYTFCNGNELVNDLKETPANSNGKTKLTGCNSCHIGDHTSPAGSTGPAAEASIDCLLCHSSEYDYRMRKPARDSEGRVVMGQDRSVKAALAVGAPGVKNCMVCHEAAGGGSLVKRGFAFTKGNDVHAAKGMGCVDCHKGKDHKMPTGTDPNNWASDGIRITCRDCHGEAPHKDADYNRHTDRIACQTCHTVGSGGGYAKDFTVWTKQSDGFYEPTTLKKEVNELAPVYAWYNGTVRNTPHLIGPAGAREDKRSKIYPFKFYMGKAFYDGNTGMLLAMDFAPPMATGDTLAGVASAAKTQGIADYKPVPGWQTIYFANSHLVTRTKALRCDNCHAVNGALRFRELGYSDEEARRLTSPELYFAKEAKRQQEEW